MPGHRFSQGIIDDGGDAGTQFFFRRIEQVFKQGGKFAGEPFAA